MPYRVLITFDCSEGSWRAVEYAGRVFSQLPGAEVTVLHILSNLPPVLWDDGHILEKQEREARQRLVERWKVEQETTCQEFLDKARGALMSAGLSAEKVSGMFKPLHADVAEDILDEVQGGGYDAVIMGRRGLGAAKSLLLGSVTNKIVQYARGCAVTIVE